MPDFPPPIETTIDNLVLIISGMQCVYVCVCINTPLPFSFKSLDTWNTACSIILYCAQPIETLPSVSLGMMLLLLADNPFDVVCMSLHKTCNSS